MKYTVSVVIPAYNEEASLKELYTRICDVLSSCERVSDFEIIFINDGSTDHSAEILHALADEDPRVSVITFAHNRGKSAGLSAGFAKAAGDLIFTIDADLQDDPADMPDFIGKLEEGYDLVSGWKTERQDRTEKKTASKIFNRTVALTFGIPLHDFDCGYKLYRAPLAKQLKLTLSIYRYIPVLAVHLGYKVTEIPVHHHPRKYGHSRYGFTRYFTGLRDYLYVIYLVKRK